MASVDNRVVKMEFDNAAFEKKVNETIGTLNKLNDSLKFAGANKGFSDIQAGASGVNFGIFRQAIDDVTAKFSTLSVIAITTISNITNRAIDAGIQLGKSLSLDQVIAGFQEYQINIKSIQTILANTRKDGTTLNEVNDALDNLNEYSDKTIYNFAQMTHNIGSATAAGVDLDTAVSYVKGFANSAALAGADAESMAGALIQMSQALGAGVIRAQDWISLERRGLAGQAQQEAFFETAKAAGTLAGVPLDKSFQEWQDEGNTLRASLEQGWLTADVFTDTMKIFTGELDAAALAGMGFAEETIPQMLELGQVAVDSATKVRTFSTLLDTAREAVASGWSESFRTLIGDFDQATELFTRASNVFGDAVGRQSELRNALLTEFVELGGRDALIESIFLSFEAVGKVIETVKEAFFDIFPKKSAGDLAYAAKVLQQFVEKLVLSEEQAETFKELLKGLFAGLKIVTTILGELANTAIFVFREILGRFDGGAILDFFLRLSSGLQDANQQLTFFNGIGMFFDALRGYLKDFISDPIGELKDLKDVIVETYTILTTGAENLGNLPGGFVDFLTNLREELLDFPDDIFNLLFKGDFTGLLGFQEDSAVVDFLFDLRETIIDLTDTVVEKFPFLERFQEAFERMTVGVNSLKDAFEPLKNIAGSVMEYIGNWAAELSGKMADAAEPGDFSKVLDAVNLGIVASIGGMLAYLSKGINFGFMRELKGTLDDLGDTLRAMTFDIKAEAILKIAAAVGILAVSALILAGIDSAALTKAMTAIAIGLAELMLGFFAVTKIGGVRGAASFTLAATGLIAMSSAILILAVAMRVLAGLGWEEISKGLSVISVLIAELVIATKLMSKNAPGVLSGSVAMIAMGIALNILAGAVAIFGMMAWESIAKGLTAITGLLLVMTIALNQMPWDSLSKGAGLLLVAFALNILAGAVAIFATMSWEEIGKGMSAIAVALLSIAVAMNLMPKTLPITAAGLVVVAGALLLIAEAMKQISQLSWEELAKAMTGIAGALIILGVAATLMGSPAALAGAVAIVILAAGLKILGTVLTDLAKISWGELLKGLIGIAAIFAVLGIAAALLTPVIPQIIALGVALALLGVGIAAIGVGAFLLASAFAIIEKAGMSAVQVVVALIDELIERIPVLAKGLALGVLEIADIILEALPIIIEQLGIIVGQLIDTTIELMPKFKELLIELLDLVISIVVEKSPDIIQAGFDLLLNFLKGIRDNIADVATVVFDIIIEFLGALAERMGDLVDAGFDVLKEFLGGIADNISEAFDAATDVITEFIKGIGDMAVDVVAAGVDTVLAFLEGVADNAIRLAEGAADIIIDFVNALADTIDEKMPELQEAGGRLAMAIADGMTFGLAGKVGDVAGGAKDLAGSVVSSVGGWLGINSPSKKFIEIGESIVEGFALGMADTRDSDKSATNLAAKASDSFQESLTMMADSLTGISEFTPTITPVLDLTNVQRDARAIGGILGTSTLQSPVTSYNQANSIATTQTEQETADALSGGTTLTFQQNIYAPEALGAADIYRQTKNQITLAKEELKI